MSAGAPVQKNKRQDNNQDERAFRVAKPQGAVHIIGHRGACGAGGKDHGPIKQWVVSFRHQLAHKGDQKQPNQNHRTDRVAHLQGHGQKVSGCLAQSGCGDLHDPKQQGDLWEFVHGFIRSHGNVLRSKLKKTQRF